MVDSLPAGRRLSSPRQGHCRDPMRPHLPGTQLQHRFCQPGGRHQGSSDDIWLVTFMDYDLGYFDLETRVLEPLENPFSPKVLPM